jgi:phosphoribosylglycinamide formyltransferase-1
LQSEILKIGFLASGNGSSARAVMAAIDDGRLPAEARLMVSNRREAAALDYARSRGVAALHIPTLPDAGAADAALAAAMQDHGVRFIVLSGYLRLLGPRVLAAYEGRILNIHPGLLPSFGGAGMYGLRVHEAVIAAGARESGATIHLVDGEYDHGAKVAEMRVAVEPGETAAELQAKITAQEPGFFVETLRRIALGEIVLPGAAVSS